jgi:anti-sigma B factor antagonist
MSTQGNQESILVIRPRPKTGGGQTNVFRLDAQGTEHLVFERDYSGNHNWSEDLVPVIRDAVAKGIDKVVVDLIELTWMNSTGLGTLMSLYSIISKAGGKTTLANPSTKIASILKVTKLDRQFSIGQSLDEAIGYFFEAGGNGNAG